MIGIAIEIEIIIDILIDQKYIGHYRLNTEMTVTPSQKP